MLFLPAASMLLAMFFLSLTQVIFAQTFTRVTDQSNPIIADGGPTQYAGASWIDYDNDGDLDLFVNNDKLYRNDGNCVKSPHKTPSTATTAYVRVLAWAMRRSWIRLKSNGLRDWLRCKQTLRLINF